MKNNMLPLLGIISVLFLSSCIGAKKMNRLKQNIEEQKQIANKLDSILEYLSAARLDKNTKGELDDSSNIAIKQIIDRRKEETTARSIALTEMENRTDRKRIKVREYKNMVSVITTGSTIMQEKMETVDFVDQLLRQQTFIKFNTAVFFLPGGYKIPAEKSAEARIAFAPLIDSLLSFIQKFPKFQLSSTIVSNGYADGQGIAVGELMNTLTANLGKKEATKEELNQELSRLRAEEIAGILLQIFKEKISGLTGSSSLETRFIKIGKGEEYPNKKITNYQVDDERRRIVVIYWNTLPKTEL